MNPIIQHPQQLSMNSPNNMNRFRVQDTSVASPRAGGSSLSGVGQETDTSSMSHGICSSIQEKIAKEPNGVRRQWR